MRLFSLIGSSLIVTGCVAVQPGKPVQEFPTSAKLAAIAVQAKTQPGAQLEFAQGGEWRAEEAGTIQEDQERVASMAPELAVKVGAQASQALDCVAHELARVVAETGDIPSLGVRRFISGRCGAWISSPAARSFTLTAPPGVDAAQVEQKIRETVAAMPPEQLGAMRGMQLGLGAARVHGAAGDQITVVTAFGEPLVELTSITRIADAKGRVSIAGRIKRPAQLAHAFINRGPLGVAACKLDPARSLPDFVLTCEMDPADDHAWVQLLAAPPGRLIATPVLEMLALRTPDAARSYRAPDELSSGRAQSAAEFQTQALQVLNDIRARAQLAPLSHAATQSDVATQVTLPFFQSVSSDGASADDLNTTIAMGLLAGWSVQGGVIAAADLAASMSEQQGDAGRWVSSALELPMARAVLLAPSASSLAIGVSLEPKGVAALAVAYQFVDPHADADRLAVDILVRLKDVRDARHLGKTVMITDTPGLNDALQSIRNKGQAPGQALENVLDHVSSSLGRSVLGFAWETHTLDGIEFPEELLRQGDLYIGAGVAQYRPAGAAWAQYAVLFAVIQAQP
ncbi:MAG: hypothetical protein QM778_22635 [Myxococcales bacterium]